MSNARSVTFYVWQSICCEDPESVKLISYPPLSGYHISTASAAVALCELDNIVAICDIRTSQFVASSTLYFSAGTKRRNSGLM
jgi:hypothetical protein